MSSDEVKGFARALLKVAWKCQGHCKEMATTEFLRDGTIAAQVCPSRYVSRIVSYGKEANTEAFRGFVQSTTQALGRVEMADIRVASRYAWDLGLDRENDDLVLKEMYWTQNYRRTKSESPDRPALYLCANSDSFFIQPLTSKESLCGSCRKLKSP